MAWRNAREYLVSISPRKGLTMDLFEKIESMVSASDTRPMIVESKRLTYEARKHLPSHAFVFPKSRSYPVHDISHARNALARASAYGSPKVKGAVYKAVFNRYPSLHDEHSHLMEYMKRSKHAVHSMMQGIPGSQNFHLLTPEEYQAKCKAAHEDGHKGCCQELANHHWVCVHHHEHQSNLHSSRGRDGLGSMHHALAEVNSDIASHYDMSLNPETHAIVNKS